MFQLLSKPMFARASLRKVALMGCAAVIAFSSTAFGAGQSAAAKAVANASPAQVILPAQFVYSYAAKFVCGYQPRIEPTTAANVFREPTVKPGNYATEINIFNPQFRDVFLRKRIVVLVRNGNAVREPESVPHVKTMTMTLKSGYATMDDCQLLWNIIGVTPPQPPANSLLIGYLVINTQRELDVDAVYTSAAVSVTVQSGTLPQPIDSENVAIDVEKVNPKRVQLNSSLFDNPPPTTPNDSR
jgi:hypothetical protein